MTNSTKAGWLLLAGFEIFALVWLGPRALAVQPVPLFVYCLARGATELRRRPIGHALHNGFQFALTGLFGMLAISLSVGILLVVGLATIAWIATGDPLGFIDYGDIPRQPGLGEQIAQWVVLVAVAGLAVFLSYAVSASEFAFAGHLAIPLVFLLFVWPEAVQHELAGRPGQPIGYLVVYGMALLFWIGGYLGIRARGRRQSPLDALLVRRQALAS
jgi:hypothetical protein